MRAGAADYERASYRPVTTTHNTTRIRHELVFTFEHQIFDLQIYCTNGYSLPISCLSGIFHI